MNPVSHMLSRIFNGEDDLTEKELVAQAEIDKAERIRFHREKVRNGPVGFKSMTNGQVRRAEERARKTQHRKAARRHRKAWMESRREHAALRGKLMMVGVLPGSSGLPVAVSVETTEFFSELLERQYGSVEVALGAYERAEAQMESERRKAAEDEAMREMTEDGR